jgi:hypothetical protein
MSSNFCGRQYGRPVSKFLNTPLTSCIFYLSSSILYLTACFSSVHRSSYVHIYFEIKPVQIFPYPILCLKMIEAICEQICVSKSHIIYLRFSGMIISQLSGVLIQISILGTRLKLGFKHQLKIVIPIEPLHSGVAGYGALKHMPPKLPKFFEVLNNSILNIFSWVLHPMAINYPYHFLIIMIK